MFINENGVSTQSVRYIFTPSSFAQRLLYYPMRIGHYFCDRQYQFSDRSKIATQPGHRVNYMLFLIKRGQMDITVDGRHAVAAGNQPLLLTGNL